MEQFEILTLIGEGTYGQVFKARVIKTGKIVAIKKFKESDQDDEHVRKTVLREIRVLKNFQNENIVRLLQVFREEEKLFLVFEYVERTVLEELEAQPEGLPLDKLKYLTYQMLKALHFMHQHDIIHRDVKPENLLVSQNGILKVCDFGFARSTLPNSSAVYTDYVSTRWYRSPELLVGDANYNKTVDIWAIGCIYAEIFSGMPLFPGDSDLHTLKLILEMMGEEQGLTEKQVQAFVTNPIYDGLAQLPDPCDGQSRLQDTLDDIDDLSLDFIQKCLQIDPQNRWSTEQLLDHPLFDEDFKVEFNLNFKLWVAQEDIQNQELIKDLSTEINETEVFNYNKKQQNIDPNFPDEFCNVDEMLSQLEMRKSLSMQHQNSLGQYSGGRVQEQIEEESSDTSSDDQIDRASHPKNAYYSGSSSAEAKSSSRCSGIVGKETLDEGTQSMVGMDDEQMQSYVNESPVKRKQNQLGNLQAEVKDINEEGHSSLKKQIIFSNAVGVTGYSPKSNKVMNQSSSNGSLIDHNNAREIIFSQLQQQTPQINKRQQAISQMSTNQNIGSMIQQKQLIVTGHPVNIHNSRASVYAGIQPQSSNTENHNHSLEVIVESPLPVTHNGIGSSTNQSALANYHNTQNNLIPQQNYQAQYQNAMPQGTHLKSLQSSLKMKQHQFTPVTKNTSKFNPAQSLIPEIHRNNSQEFLAAVQMSTSSMSQGLIAQNNNAVLENHLYYLNNQATNFSGLKKINITFNQQQADALSYHVRESLGGGNHYLQINEGGVGGSSMSPKLKQVYNPKMQQTASINQSQQKRVPNHMNQTARDNSPIKSLNQQLVNKFLMQEQLKPPPQTQANNGKKSLMKGGSSSIEQIVIENSDNGSIFLSPNLKQQSIKQPNLKVNQNQNQSSVKINAVSNQGKNQDLNNRIISKIASPQKPHGSPSPIKPGFPKLIDQYKDTESHKSFMKVNSMSVNEQGSNYHTSQSPDSHHNQQPIMISFNNQFLNDSLQNQVGLPQQPSGASGSFISVAANSLNKKAVVTNYKENVSSNIKKDAIIGESTGKNSQQKQSGLYEMDFFPRRSITNRLKNVQMLHNRKNNNRVNNERTNATMFPQIHNPPQQQTFSPIKSSGLTEMNLGSGSKIVDLQQNSKMPESSIGFPNNIQNNQVMGSRHHNQMAGHSTIFKMKASGYAGGFFKPKTPGESNFYEPQSSHQGANNFQVQHNNYQSNQNSNALNSGGFSSTKSPNISEKGMSKIPISMQATAITIQNATAISQLTSTLKGGLSNSATVQQVNLPINKTVRIGGHHTTQIFGPVLSTNLIRNTYA